MRVNTLTKRAKNAKPIKSALLDIISQAGLKNVGHYYLAQKVNFSIEKWTNVQKFLLVKKELTSK